MGPCKHGLPLVHCTSTRSQLISCSQSLIMNIVNMGNQQVNYKVPPFKETPLRIFHSLALAPLISAISSLELHSVPMEVLWPYDPLLSPQTKSDSVTSSARLRRMSKNRDSY